MMSKMKCGKGDAVQIVGLDTETHFNGAQGVVEEWDAEKGRFCVLLTDGEWHRGFETVLLVMPENLVVMAARKDARA